MDKTTNPDRSGEIGLHKPGLVLLCLFLCSTSAGANMDSLLANTNSVMTAEIQNGNVWWTSRTAGIFGGIGGSVVGLVGALVGIFTSIGKFRRFVLSLMIVWVVFGVICLVIGVVSLLSEQPYAVYYPLLLFGFLCTLLPACLYRGVRKRYEEFELRKLAARDVS